MQWKRSGVSTIVPPPRLIRWAYGSPSWPSSTATQDASTCAPYTTKELEVAELDCMPLARFLRDIPRYQRDSAWCDVLLIFQSRPLQRTQYSVRTSSIIFRAIKSVIDMVYYVVYDRTAHLLRVTRQCRAA